MSKIKLIDLSGNTNKDYTVDSALLVETPHKQAMFDAVLVENAAERQGTHSTLTKGEVRGGGKKPWRQKHTGRARTGSTRNPHWTGGGVAFGPKPGRNYTLKQNSKVRRLAFKSALTVKLSDSKLYALENGLDIQVPSTKTVANLLSNAKMTGKKVLFVLGDVNATFAKSTSNIQKVETKMWNTVSVRDLLHANIVIVQESAFDKYKELMA